MVANFAIVANPTSVANIREPGDVTDPTICGGSTITFTNLYDDVIAQPPVETRRGHDCPGNRHLLEVTDDLYCGMFQVFLTF